VRWSAIPICTTFQTPPARRPQLLPGLHRRSGRLLSPGAFERFHNFRHTPLVQSILAARLFCDTPNLCESQFGIPRKREGGPKRQAVAKASWSAFTRNNCRAWIIGRQRKRMAPRGPKRSAAWSRPGSPGRSVRVPSDRCSWIFGFKTSDLTASSPSDKAKRETLRCASRRSRARWNNRVWNFLGASWLSLGQSLGSS
jgi:hypothetical protein